MNGIAQVARYRRLKANAESDQRLKQTIEASLQYLSLTAHGCVRVTRPVAHAILLGSPHVLNGKVFSVNGKSVGAGVWELSRGQEVA
jgi:hypothetical protein